MMALALFSTNDTDWEDRVLTYTERYSEAHGKKGQKELLTRGELEQIHGKKRPLN